jgi:hypothetical protein
MRILIAICAAILSLSPVFADALEFRVKGGETVGLAGADATVALTGVVDQRCPADVDCYWEGMIRVELTVTHGAASEVIVLCNLCDGATREAKVAGQTVTLARLEPGRDVLDPLSRLIVLADYTVVLRIGE